MQDIAICIIHACMIVFPFFIISLARAKSPRRQKAALNEILAKGHTVNAVLKKKNGAVSDPYSRSASGRTSLGIYEYEFKGKRYKYRRYSDYVPGKVRLYFLKNPRKAREENDLGSSKTCWPLIIAIIACGIYVFRKIST